jgi:hypothetical protein
VTDEPSHYIRKSPRRLDFVSPREKGAHETRKLGQSDAFGRERGFRSLSVGKKDQQEEGHERYCAGRREAVSAKCAANPLGQNGEARFKRAARHDDDGRVQEGEESADSVETAREVRKQLKRNTERAACEQQREALFKQAEH